MRSRNTATLPTRRRPYTVCPRAWRLPSCRQLWAIPVITMTIMDPNATDEKRGSACSNRTLGTRQHAGPKQNQAAEPNRDGRKVEDADHDANGGVGVGAGMSAQRR